MNEPSFVTWPEQSVPVLGTFDVVVVGSGSAGVCAALASARRGATTLLLEASPVIGGTAATGLPLLTTNDYKGRQLAFGVLQEIFDTLKREQAFDGNLARGFYFCYDVDKYRLVVTRLLLQAGVTIRTHTRLVGVRKSEARLTHVMVHRKEGFGAYQGRAFVDCSGDADLAYLAGEPMLPNECDGQMQPPTLLFFVGGVDSAAVDWSAITALWDHLRPEKRWLNPRLGPALSPPFAYPGKPGFHGFNVTRSLGVDATKTEDLVRMEIEQREQVDEFFHRFLKPHVLAFRDAYFAGTAFAAGVRETRRIAGDFVLHGVSIRERAKFEDAVAWSAYPIDRHSGVKGSTDFRHEETRLPGHYEVPFRVMVPKLTPNLLVSGRCVSADEIAFSAVRVMGTTIPLGYAAGLGAAQIAIEGVTARSIKVEVIRAILTSEGAPVDLAL
ncbi:MAG TPA: FAD-dependent oxidoreductase [Opitutaceae bacterium]|nr:FAD-dependent oxidoreductase [Opitutaceae bacterium]